jgi:hypothetical protein
MKGNVITVIKIQLNVRRHRNYHNQTTKTKQKTPHSTTFYLLYAVLYARRFVSCLVRLRFNPWPVAHKQLTD